MKYFDVPFLSFEKLLLPIWICRVTWVFPFSRDYCLVLILTSRFFF